MDRSLVYGKENMLQHYNNRLYEEADIFSFENYKNEYILTQFEA